MHYEYTLSAPANTPANAPARLNCKLTHGVLTQIRLMYAPEGNGVLFSRVLRGGFQLYPLNPESAVQSAWPPREWVEYEELLAEPYILTLEAWNEDDVNAHTVYLSLTLLPQEVAAGRQEDLSLIGKILRKVLGI